MGLFTSFDANRDRFSNSGLSGRLVVNLDDFVVNGTPIGNAPWSGDFFSEELNNDEHLSSEQNGYELETTGGKLTSVLITLEKFTGSFLVKSQVTPLTTATTPRNITKLFGEPYWTDRDDDDELILFYEYRKGNIELQFEFSNGNHLGFLTMVKDGILSKEEQRKSYGVDRPWPPEEKR